MLMLLRSTEDENMQRVVTGAIANFAIHNANTPNPHTLKMIAGAIANLCGNDKLQIKLRSEVGIAALLGMAKYEHPDVLAQIAHGIANFALCETRSSTQGTKNGKSLLIEDGALSWIVQNAKTETSATRRHIELALCYLGKHEANAKEMVKEGALWELVRISRDFSSEDIRSLAHKTLTSNLSFLTELKEAEAEAHQQYVVEADVLTSLLMLLSNTRDENLHKFAASAISILAMNITNQELITDQGGIGLLSSTAATAKDPQTLKMVAIAIANLCGKDKLQTKLLSEGGIAALLGMVKCGNLEVQAQVARGIANFAFCETRALNQGTKIDKSILLKDDLLSWIVHNAKTACSTIGQYMELALCHFAQHEGNAKEMVKEGAIWELVKISRDGSREDIRSLAHRTLTSKANLKKIMERSFTSMLIYLRNTKDETVQKDVAFLIANFALSKTYQEQIMDKGCISLLWSAAATAQDPQTLTMFAKAIANLCGNGNY
ncbi:unnamed protein product [Arabis nemorensis]|uniref:Vacuolar protein 8 n=1 Tax=Arabis nemorensis TaxID=586526 RepID=A0A565ARC4_9BRAS|nr:unnamed protein product [Arabis nemorensis]